MVSRWEVGQREASKDSVPEGESVPVEELEDGLAFMAEPGYIYEITGSWRKGKRPTDLKLLRKTHDAKKDFM